MKFKKKSLARNFKSDDDVDSKTVIKMPLKL